jgi:N-acetylmuramoyl-L-alanine amidase
MPVQHTVVEGDSVIKLADIHGFFPDTLWNHPANAALKSKRKDMNELLPGDVVVIPDKKEKSQTVATGASHKFRRKGIPALYRLQVFDVEDPRANQEYTLNVDGRELRGSTDEDGVLEQYVPATAREGELIIGPDRLRVLIDFGYLDPITAITGVQKRLNNLGFFCGEPSGTLDAATQDALADFQFRFDLDETGEPDQATLQKLEEVHDHPHEFEEEEGVGGGGGAG